MLLQIVRPAERVGELLPGNKFIDKLTLNIGEDVEIKCDYSMLYICETARIGSRALFATGWDKVSKWNGDSEWTSSDESDKFCFFRSASKPGSFVLKNNRVDNGIFDVYIL